MLDCWHELQNLKQVADDTNERNEDLFEVNYNNQVQNGSVEQRSSGSISAINRVSGMSDITDVAENIWKQQKCGHRMTD